MCAKWKAAVNNPWWLWFTVIFTTWRVPKQVCSPGEFMKYWEYITACFSLKLSSLDVVLPCMNSKTRFSDHLRSTVDTVSHVYYNSNRCMFHKLHQGLWLTTSLLSHLLPHWCTMPCFREAKHHSKAPEQRCIKCCCNAYWWARWHFLQLSIKADSEDNSNPTASRFS